MELILSRVEAISLKQAEISLNQKEAALNQKEAALNQKEATLKQDEKLNSIERFVVATGLLLPSESPSVLGANVLKKSQAHGGIGLPLFCNTLTGPPILPQGRMPDFREKKEVDFVAFITPFLIPCFPPGFVVVNSENHKWIDVKSGNKNNDLKPDVIGCHPAFYSAETHDDEIDRDYSPKFGIIPHTCLYGSVFVGAAKLMATPTALGELLLYLEWIGFHSGREARGLLLSVHECQLVEVERKVVTRFCRVPWSAAGSLGFVQDFFASYDIPMAHTIDACCKEMKVDVAEGRSFLGRGGSGAVFKVKRGRDSLALKIVVNTAEKPDAVDELEREFECSRNPSLADLFIPGVSFLSLGTSAGLLLNEAAALTAKRSTEGIVDIIFRRLYDLHVMGFTHGDPRLANFVWCVRSGWKWIDLRESSSSSLSADVARDVKLLVESIISPKPLSSLAGIDSAIRLYSSKPTVDTMTGVITIVKSLE